MIKCTFWVTKFARRGICVYVYIYIYIHVYIFMFIYIYIYVYIYICICMYLQICIYIYPYIYWYTYICVCMLTLVCYLFVGKSCVSSDAFNTVNTRSIGQESYGSNAQGSSCCCFWRCIYSHSSARENTCDYCVLVRGGGLGSSTIFKKFHEPYAPS